MTQTVKRYRLSTKKLCPTCGGKAQDPQTFGPTLLDQDANGKPIYSDATPEPCDEPYHDVTDPDYVED